MANKAFRYAIQWFAVNMERHIRLLACSDDRYTWRDVRAYWTSKARVSGGVSMAIHGERVLDHYKKLASGVIAMALATASTVRCRRPTSFLS